MFTYLIKLVLFRRWLVMARDFGAKLVSGEARWRVAAVPGSRRLQPARCGPTRRLKPAATFIRPPAPLSVRDCRRNCRLHNRRLSAAAAPRPAGDRRKQADLESRREQAVSDPADGAALVAVQLLAD
jgi:hypothetical protein